MRTELTVASPPDEEIWPHWDQGVPTTLKRLRRPLFGNPRDGYDALELSWTYTLHLSRLKKKRGHLPRNVRSEWSGVYRIFATDTIIDRCCGKDPTGTLYIGSAGTGKGKWSTLRTRIDQVVNGKHQAMRDCWHFSELMQQKYSWDCLALEWACTDKERPDYSGNQFSEALMAESWLLCCYKDSFGEFPPWNKDEPRCPLF